MGAHPKPVAPKEGAKHAENKLICSIAAKLDDARVLQNMSVETLSKKSGVPSVAIVRLLRGQVDSRLSTIADLAQALGLDMRALFGAKQPDISVNGAEFSALLTECDPETRRGAVVLLRGIKNVDQKEIKR